MSNWLSHWEWFDAELDALQLEVPPVQPTPTPAQQAELAALQVQAQSLARRYIEREKNIRFLKAGVRIVLARG